jgi:TatA/E family protein of Tat protein translocase
VGPLRAVEKEALMLADIFGPDLLIVVIVLAVVIFGAGAIPKLARNLGSVKNEFERGMKESNGDVGVVSDAPAEPTTSK